MYVTGVSFGHAVYGLDYMYRVGFFPRGGGRVHGSSFWHQYNIM